MKQPGQIFGGNSDASPTILWPATSGWWRLRKATAVSTSSQD